ncbi:MAG: 50S ribosomal protein L9 [Deltaproteobacteria bacterium]|nr:50S ribosomal protein L9 [Deltaproteobacteria bacterium]
MKVILMQDVEPLGLEGDIVDVARGYARNYLVPKGISVEATNGNLTMLEARKKKIMAKRMKDKEEAERIKEKISQVVLTIKGKAGEEGKLYGSVTSRDIAQELENKDIIVDRKKVIIDEPIRTLGEYEVGIKLYPEVLAQIKVIVEKLEEEKALE